VTERINKILRIILEEKLNINDTELNPLREDK
jgi:hypothetical protein